MARRRFFVDEVRAGRAELAGDDAHHLVRVLRVEPGQKYEISDSSSVFLAEVETVRKDLVSFTILEPIPQPEPAVHITLAASLIRFERFEWLLEKATELGVETIVPVQAARSETGLDTAAAKRVARWRKIVREASEQSRRVKTPDIEPPMPLSRALSIESDFRYALDEAPGTAPLRAAMPSERSPRDRVALLVGPEGGWVDRERASMVERGWTSVGLGPAILRTETAAIAAVALVVSAWQN